MSILALLVAFAQGVVRADNGNVGVRNFYVRATKYHWSDRNCDPWTMRGQTSTQLRLPKLNSVIEDPDRIGNVALDPKKIPEGSLVFETQTKRFFVSTTGGDAVIRRDAAKKLAKGSIKKKNALVFDFYSPREVVENHFTYCWVIPHEGKRFRSLNREDQQKRLTKEFWINRLLEIYAESSDEEETRQLGEMINKLREKGND